MNIAILVFFILLAFSVFLYLRPNFINEGFATIALDAKTMPQCFLRDIQAQELLTQFEAVRKMPPASESAMAYNELVLILQKVLCIDADVSGSGAGPYSTYKLPFATAHDIEPAASFVGRCVRSAVRSRDIEMVMEKFETRGVELIGILCQDKKVRQETMDKFHNILARANRKITDKCLMEKASLDTPAGPRDPGYYEPPSLEGPSPYKITGGYQYF